MTTSPNPIDVHVGSRVRLRRMTIGMSQEKLGNALGLTFQQIQKYEKGVNRVGASRLLNIAANLDAPVEFFFADMPPEIDPTAGPNAKPETACSDVMKFVGSAEGLQLNTAFNQITSSEQRRGIVDLVRVMAE